MPYDTSYDSTPTHEVIHDQLIKSPSSFYNHILRLQLTYPGPSFPTGCLQGYPSD